jgi:outer membrane protein assembly factor BamB
MSFIYRITFLMTLLTIFGCGAQATGPIAIEAKQPIAGTDVVAKPNDWPWWRGPQLDGHGSGSVPTKWTKNENVVWKSPIVGKGFASPIVCGDRAFVATADEEAEKQLLMCFDRETGKKLWSQTVHEGGFMKKHPDNSHASATPACDGEQVFTVFINGGALWVTAFDLAGKQLWQKEVGPFESEHGYGPSPVLYKSAIIVVGDNLQPSYMAALDRKSGDIIWRIPRERLDIHANYATPLVGRIAGRDQLVITGYSKVTSYDPATGKLLWFCAGPAQVAACTASFHDNMIFASGGFPEKEILAIRADGSGDVTDSHIVWRTGKGVTYVPSPIYHDGHLYVVTDGGIAYCYDANSGDEVWQKRLEGKFSASPVIADGKLFVTNEAGVTTVLKASPEFEVLAVNDLAADGHATPAIAGGRIYLRAGETLYCVGADERQAATARY